MKTIILPGYSERNRQWAEDMAGKMRLKGEIIVHNWRHWDSDKSFSFKYETEKILREAGEGKFSILAKSVGSRVALRLMAQAKKRISKVILTGIASTGKDMSRIMVKALPYFPVEHLLVIQNTNDPYSGYSDVEKLIHSINPKVKITEKPGTEHNYPYPKVFEKFLTDTTS